MTKHTNSKLPSRSKGFGQRTKKTIARPKWAREIRSLMPLLAALMRQTGAPRCSQEKYLAFLKKQLLNRGSGFLKQTRPFPIYGLRLLGGDMKGERSTRKMFGNMKMRPNADGILVPIFLAWYWNRLIYLGRVKEPTKENALEVSRILAVLSFSKMILLDCKRSRKRAMIEYESRLKNVNGKLPLKEIMETEPPEYYSDMVEFCNSHGSFNQGKPHKFDRRCYSLKALVGKRPYRPPVPPAYGFPRATAVLLPYDENGSLRPNNLVNVINRFYYDKKPYDAQLCIIAESGGKYRGICPYTSPYAHSINLYSMARSLLLRISGNCNYNQEAGHEVGRLMSCNNQTKVSADASNFTDTINVEQLAYMAMALGSSGAVHYHHKLRIRGFDGEIFNSPIPLMGWKGTFDLASVLLSYSFWKERKKFPPGMKVQCGDDYLGYGRLEDYQRCYEAIGCKLSEEKTVVSRRVTIFCGEMFWRGHKITPIRFLVSGMSENHKFIGKLINRTRSFVENCNYSPRTKRYIYGFIKRNVMSRYKGYLDFRLPHSLGGIQLDLGDKLPLVPYLESKKKALFCALCNIPHESEEFDGYCTHFSHLPLGKPYSKVGQELPLTQGSWPRKSRTIFSRRRRDVYRLLRANRASIADVLLYLYDGTVLKP